MRGRSSISCAALWLLVACAGSTAESGATSLARGGAAHEAADTARGGAMSHDDARDDVNDPLITDLDAQVATAALSPSFVYVGGWVDGTYPFRTYALDRARGTLSQVGGDAQLGVNPSFCTGSADGRFLYVGNEAFSGGTPGVSVAALDARGVPTFRRQVPVDAGGTIVFTSIVKGGRVLLAADYNGGRALSYRVEADGGLSGPLDQERFAGPSNGQGPETHSFVPHPSGRFGYAPNKALDKIAQLALDANTGKLEPLSEPFAQAEDEPRMLAFDPSGAFAYVMHERSSRLVTYTVRADGRLQKVDSKSTLPSSATSASLGAHVRVHPSGKYLYASNRDGDASTLAAFALEDGIPRLLGHVPSGGKGPRHFDVDPSGHWLVVANQGTRNGRDGTLAVFAIGTDGKLTSAGQPVTGLVEPTSATLVTRTP